MTFPTIPTAAAGRVITAVQANTTATRTFPDLSGLTKNSGDLLVAIIVCYQSSLTSNIFSSWGASFTELRDVGVSSQHCVGIAYKWSTGSETGTFTVAQAGTVTGHAAMIVVSIPGAHASTAPEALAALATGTSAAADPGALNPSWGAEDNLWLAIRGSGETSTTGSYTGLGNPPANYSDSAQTGISADAVGGVEAGVSFRQLNASSEDVGTGACDTSNARNCAIVVAVRPAPPPNASGTGAISVPSATVSGTGELVLTATGAVTAGAPTVSGSGEEVFTATGAVAVPAPTVAGTGEHDEGTPQNPDGSGAISVPSATVSGSGALVLAGSGAVTVPAPTVSGTGVEAFTSTGAISVLAPVVDGSGLLVVPVSGSGAITVPAATVSGTGDGGASDGSGQRRRRLRRRTPVVLPPVTRITHEDDDELGMLL